MSRWCLALLMMLVGSLTLPGCAGPPPASDRVRVAVSIPPLADMARQIGGERVAVELLVPPGTSVHTYEPTPRQVQFVATADLLVVNGVRLEFWAPKVIAAASNQRLRVVETAEGLEILEQEHEEGGNPHVWLDPVNAMHQAERIRDALVAADPEHRSEYEANGARYLEALQALDEELRAETAAWSQRRFIGFHSAWVYFARRYGLEQVAAIEEFPGKEPSPEHLASIVDLVRQTGVRAIFAEPQLPPRAAEAVAAEAKVEVIVLDPLGGVEGRKTYAELLRYNVAQMGKALRK